MAFKLSRYRGSSKSIQISKPTTFSVTYLGYLPLENEAEAKNSRANINAILKDANTLKKMTVKVTEQELILIDPNNKTEITFATEKIYKCSAEVGEESVFSFVYDKQDHNPRFECHAVLCTGKVTAAGIANSLQTSFKDAELSTARNLRERQKLR